MLANKKANIFAIILILIYTVSSFFLVKDYGITIDEPAGFGLGHKYLYYYHTGHLDMKDDLPEIADHPCFYNRHAKEFYFHEWPFANTLSAITCYLFFQKLNILDPVSAHHIIIPLLMLLLLFFLFLFVKKYWGSLAGLLSVLALLTYPRFFGHTFNNIKDISEIAFFSITIMLFAQWVMSEKLKYLYWSFIFWAFALATKMDAVFIPIILFLWQIPTLYTYLRQNIAIKTRTLFHIIAGFFIAALTTVTLFPLLQPWPYKNIKDFFIIAPKYIYNMLRQTCAIGNNINISWNLYAPTYIAYTTPILMLLFFIIGFGYLLFSIRRQKLNLLLLIWLLLPIVRHSFPKVNHYDGLRHFLIFVVPFAIIISQGIIFSAKMISKKLNLQKELLLTSFFALLLFIPNIYTLITLHPFQTTYFNFLVGGLKGAQEKDIPFSSDYWYNSLRKAADWLNKNAKNNAHITPLSYELLYFYSLRDDLKIIRLEKDKIPSNTYLINVPRKWIRLDQKEPTLKEKYPEINRLEAVYQIKRQGGEIVTIYYKP